MPAAKNLTELVERVRHALSECARGNVCLTPEGRKGVRWAPLFVPEKKPAPPAHLHSYNLLSLALHLDCVQHTKFGERADRNLETVILLLQLLEQGKISEPVFDMAVSGEQPLAVDTLRRLAREQQ